MSWGLEKRFAPKKNKMGAKQCRVDGIRFDSKAEAEYYSHLKFLEQVGAIKILELQPKVYMTRTRILYKPDFYLEDQGQKYYVDVKGMETDIFKRNKRHWVFYGAGELRIVKKSGRGFKTIETIFTKDE